MSAIDITLLIYAAIITGAVCYYAVQGYRLLRSRTRRR
jgi:hypothetical protein